MTENETIDIDSRVDAVSYVGPEYIVAVTWAGEPEPHEIDLTPLVFKYGHLKPLRDLEVFKTVRVAEFGYGLDWPGSDDLEVSPDQLRQLETAQRALGLRPSYFRLWLKQHAGTAENAASLLGVSRRTIAAHAVGDASLDLRTTLAIGALLLARDRSGRKPEIGQLLRAIERTILRHMADPQVSEHALTGSTATSTNAVENAITTTQEARTTKDPWSTDWSSQTTETREDVRLYVYRTD